MYGEYQYLQKWCLKKIWDWICSHGVEQPCQFGINATGYLQVTYCLHGRSLLMAESFKYIVNESMECIPYLLFSNVFKENFCQHESASFKTLTIRNKNSQKIPKTKMNTKNPLFVGRRFLFQTIIFRVQPFVFGTVPFGPPRPLQLFCSSARRCCCFGGAFDVRQVVVQW